MRAGDAIVAHTSLVMRIANHMVARLPASIDVQDLVQAGMIGLLEAAARFDEEQGAEFGAFASQRIRGAMLDELRDLDWLPRSSRRGQRAIEAAKSAVQQREMRAPTERELAREMSMPLKAYQRLLHSARGPELVHFDEYEAADGESFFERRLPDVRNEPVSVLIEREFCRAMDLAVRNLSKREQELVDLYYGQELTFEQIGALWGVTESRVCQVNGGVVKRLQRGMREYL